VIASLVLSLPACVRPASKAPEGTPTTSQGGFPLPGTAVDVMGQLESFATQTAIAMLGPGAGAPVVSTSQGTPVTAEGVVSTPAPQASPKVKKVYPQATPGKPKTYTLKKGEHPYCIARRFNVNPEEMLRQSGLGSGGTYVTGTVLKIPSGGSFPGKRALKSHPTTYTVRAGDTIYSIACDFGDADPNMIIRANDLKSPYTLKSGQKLDIP